MNVLIGNIIALLGCTIMVLVGLIKQKKKILAVQCVQFVLQGAANLILGGVSGFVANFVSIFRNIAFFKFKNTVWLKLFFIALQVALSIPSLKNGFINYLPLLSGVIFTWFLDLENEVHLKIVIIIAQVMWLYYDFVHVNYVSVAFDTFTLISTVIGIFLILNDRKKKNDADCS